MNMVKRKIEKHIDKSYIIDMIKKYGVMYTSKELGIGKSTISCWKKNLDNYGDIYLTTTRTKKSIGSLTHLKCSRCNEVLSLNNFQYRKDRMTYNSWCKSCVKNQRKGLRIKVIEKFGKKCKCGCDIYDLLEIHHINGNGNIERKNKDKYVIYNQILKMNEIDMLKKFELKCILCHDLIHMSKENRERFKVKWLNEGV